MLGSDQARVKTFALYLDRPYGLRIHWHLENYPWIERTIRSAKIHHRHRLDQIEGGSLLRSYPFLAERDYVQNRRLGRQAY